MLWDRNADEGIGGGGLTRAVPVCEQRRTEMKVENGDVLVCDCADCHLEVEVTRVCTTESCGEACDVDARCCGKPMKKKSKQGS